MRSTRRMRPPFLRWRRCSIQTMRNNSKQKIRSTAAQASRMMSCRVAPLLLGDRQRSHDGAKHRVVPFAIIFARLAHDQERAAGVSRQRVRQAVVVSTVMKSMSWPMAAWPAMVWMAFSTSSSLYSLLIASRV